MRSIPDIVPVPISGRHSHLRPPDRRLARSGQSKTRALKFRVCPHIASRSKRFSFPNALVEVQNPSSFELKVWIAGKYPTAVMPWTDCILVEPPPQGGAADLSHKSPVDHFSDQIVPTKPRQGQTSGCWQLTSQSLHCHHQFWGGKGADALFAVGQSDRSGGLGKTAFAIC